ncbi:HAD family hydrolase [Priestia megaterium]|uniref:HAD family phosphatase n=1 Tax=Priestia megaterium TaxID=1404 RepID=UPI001D00D4B8|nr:HAD family phosphatase [Priestia megaterium]
MNQLAFIFDMDSLIVDSEPVYHSRNKDIFKKLEREVDKDTQLSFIRGTAKRKWTILTREFLLIPT